MIHPLRVKVHRPPIPRSKHVVVEVPPIAGRILPRPQRAARATNPLLRAKRSVLPKLLGVIIRPHDEAKLGRHAYKAARRVDRLKRQAVAGAQPSAHNPARLPLQLVAARRRHLLGPDGVAAVSNVALRTAGRGGAQRDVRADGEARPAGQRGDGVLGPDNVGLHLGLGLVRRVARGHGPLVEGALGAVAVVAPDAEEDSALLVHLLVALGPVAAVERRQRAGRAVAAADGVVARLALDHGRDEARRYGWVSVVLAGRAAGEDAVLEVGLDPGPVAGAFVAAVAEVDGLHLAVACVPVVPLGVSVVEAAARVVVRAVEHGVYALRLVLGRRAHGRVVAVAVVGRDEDAVCLFVAERHRGANGAGEGIVAPCFRAARGAAGRSLGEVVVAAGLVVDDGDDAGCAGAERVLVAGVGYAAG